MVTLSLVGKDNGSLMMEMDNQYGDSYETAAPASIARDLGGH